jgi:hypothetical protein
MTFVAGFGESNLLMSGLLTQGKLLGARANCTSTGQTRNRFPVNRSVAGSSPTSHVPATGLLLMEKSVWLIVKADGLSVWSRIVSCQYLKSVFRGT